MEKMLDDFDFKFQPSIDKASIKEIASLKFIHNAENVVFVGPPGVGKAHLAISLGIEAAKAGFRVNFINASILVERLAKAEKEKKLEDKIRGLSKFQLLIIDEIGYLPFDELGAHCFFQLISRRYEKASIPHSYVKLDKTKTRGRFYPPPSEPFRTTYPALTRYAIISSKPIS